jgi:hypothetical protein
VGWTRNLSEAGACLELAEVLSPDTPLRLRLQTDRGAIEVEARVVWARAANPASGVFSHGVAFTQVAPDQRQALRDLLRSKSDVRHAGVRVPLDLAVTCQGVEGGAGDSIPGRTRDIGRGGLMLRLPQALPVGTRLRVTLHAPADLLTLEGTIVWIASQERRGRRDLIGHGLRFTVLDESISHSLGSLLAEPL